VKRTDAVSGPNASAGKEARRFPRYNVNMRVAVQLHREGALESLWGRANEIGQDGMSATLTHELQPGEVASLEFTLPGTMMVIRLRAAVRYRHGFRHGFEFLTLSEQHREILCRALKMLEEQS